MSFSLRAAYPLLMAIILSNFVLWLDSFDRYLSGRYHVEMSGVLPEAFFSPSRELQAFIRQAIEPAPGAPLPVVVASEIIVHGIAPEAVPEIASEVAPEPSPPQEEDAVKPPASPAAVKAVPAQTAHRREAVPMPYDPGASPRILFAGDSMMQGLAPYTIARIRKIYPEGFYSDQSRQSTGLTMRRYFDWPLHIQAEIARHRFDTLVIFLGPNDPWDITEDGRRYVFPSAGWVERYRSRVAEIMAFCQKNRVRVIWIGLPNMRNERVREGAIVENRIFREEAQRFGFAFLPMDTLLGGFDEPFSKHIDDPVKGKLAVRAEDGTHFTPAGLRLMSAHLAAVIDSGIIP